MEDKFCPSCEQQVIEKLPPCPLQCMSPKCKAYKPRPSLNHEHVPMIWILGGPGCGKGTQCSMIKGKYGYTHVSTGDLLRDEIKAGSIRSQCIRNIIERGGLVPTDIVLDVLKVAIMQLEPTSIGFLIDGYPREKHQGVEFEKTICPASLIIYFEVCSDTMYKRLMGRAEKSQRVDDNEETIKMRIATFIMNNDEILSQYGDSGKLIRINAEAPPDVVFRQVQTYMDPVVKSAAEKVAKAAALPKTLPTIKFDTSVDKPPSPPPPSQKEKPVK